MNTLRVVGYARLSRASEDSTSIARQREVIERTAEARGWTLVNIFEDVDLSGTTDRAQRPGLNAALSACESGEAQAMLVWRLDRACRGVGQFVGWLDAGINVVSATEPIDTTSPMGRAMAQVLQVFAELEARTTGLRVAASQEHLRRIGRWSGGVVPYGYDVTAHPDGAGKALVVNSDEAAVVRRMADAVLTGETVYGVCKALNAEQIPTKRGAQWQPTTVQRILTADSTLGRAVHKGNVVRDDEGMPLVPWTPLLAVDEVMRLRALLGHNDRKRDHAPRKRAEFLYSGLLRCSGCGNTLHGRNRRGEAMYVCPLSARGQDCPKAVLITESSVDAEVRDEYLRRVGFFKVTEVIEEVSEAAGLIEVEAAIADIAREMTRPGADVTALAATLTDLHKRREAMPAGPVTTTRTVETDETIAARWERADTAMRRDLLADAIDFVTVLPGARGRRVKRCEVSWRQ